MNCREIYVLAFVDLLFVCSRTSTYYTKNYGGYNLAIRDNAGSQWASQAGARQWCKNNLNGSSSLASVTNSEIETNIEQFANDAISANYLSTNNVVLNAHLQLTDGWLWLNGQSLINAEVQGQTAAASYLLYAYVLTGNYSLIASKPTDKRSYLCQYTGETSNCGDNGFQFNGRCYRKYDNAKVSWFDARSSCQSEGGDLASFDFLTKDTLSTLSSSGLNPATSTDYWVGLKRLKWNWNDIGFEANFTYWNDNHPSDYNMKCICLGARHLYKWKWIDCDCDQSQQFICFTALSKTTTPTSSLPSPISSPKHTSVSTKPLTTNYSNMSSLKPNDILITPASPSESSEHIKSGQAMAVGLGVGLGVGLPLIILLIVVVALLIRKRKRSNYRNPVVSNKSSPSLASESLDSPQTERHNDGEMISKKDQPGVIYAMVLQSKEGDHSTAVTQHQPVVYDKLEHINQHQ